MTSPLEGWWAQLRPDLLTMMSSVGALFEASDLKHELARAGFMRPAAWHPSPFEPDAFFGDIVLTAGDSPSELYGPCVDEAACVFFSGVVARPFFGGLVRPEREGHVELQVGVVMMERLARPLPISASWTMSRAPRGSSGLLTLVSRTKLQRMLDECRQDRPLLLRDRDRFFQGRWSELSSCGLAARWQRA